MLISKNLNSLPPRISNKEILERKVTVPGSAALARLLLSAPGFPGTMMRNTAGARSATLANVQTWKHRGINKAISSETTLGDGNQWLSMFQGLDSKVYCA